ncbi:chaplin [Streptomyces sp. bgisy100]|uniref:chaplin n=1 Tax=Streptomyces sp. bgisy100 TaxID=3413783 RepID=UPI003D75CE4B
MHARTFLSAGVLAAAAILGSGAAAIADSGAQGAAAGSPGLLSGNVVQAPASVPVNLCGNTVDVLAGWNEAADNTCGSD